MARSFNIGLVNIGYEGNIGKRDSLEIILKKSWFATSYNLLMYGSDSIIFNETLLFVLKFFDLRD